MTTWPEWLDGWLKLEDYGQVKCRRHVSHYNTLYCVTCQDKPMCDECWKHSTLHQGLHHQTFKGVRCSRRVGIQVKDIGKVMDVKRIQVYSINHKIIVFLNPNTASASRAKYDPPCHTCKRKLIVSEYMFCSIACMVGYNGRNMAIEEEKSESEKSSRSSDIEFVGNDKLVGERLISAANMGISSDNDQCCSSSTSSFSFRKRSRKALPRRAPLK